MGSAITMLSISRKGVVLLLCTIGVLSMYLLYTRETPLHLENTNVASSPKIIINHRDIRVMPAETRTRFTGNASDMEPDAEITAETKLILLWTNWFGTRYHDWHFGLGKGPFRHWGCSARDCVITRDRTLYEQADMIVFNFIKNDFLPAGFPALRWPDQLYVFIISESPATVTWPPSMAQEYNGFFNLSMTYRADSDIRYQQILVEPLEGVTQEEKSRQREEIVRRVKRRDLERRMEGRATSPVHPFQRDNNTPVPRTLPDSTSALGTLSDSSLANRTLAPIAWMVSNCRTRSRREQYVRELQKYIGVDVFGRCGTIKCGDNRERQNTCYDYLQKHYKFYLSFENSECKDYVTEKLANVLPLDLVPIVLGGTNYSRDTPPNSVINVYDFRTPRHLAAHVKTLDRNVERYLEYFRWKTDFRVVNGSLATPGSYCKFCDILHDRNFRKPRVVRDLAGFWPPADKVCVNKMIRDHLRTNAEDFSVDNNP